ncbi:TPA: ATP-binding protein [Vibrio parahaemolyticus]|uniref:ATP-binding protein n=1 Tax=Vibrio parahaemolyticus TaxID=670 RepID=UPI000FEC502A|nr:ATP-binding protein [Vibrio parahaemolyticus]MCX8885272.1 ATP-binding protein [Vibrio parahaemolyticus]HAS3028944.1 ATP-binding protein [Vibrio parahaemolyticus]HAS3030908.1 ATP-binding protein [Vibrio parahaemolyticus]HAS3034221.1 ATP-binding protein [Vibrio parahaemolyticus]HAS3035936.1 ATP-binding protein [Vibrio parahaemolyticus]
MNNAIPSISESFNAKTTTAEELCSTFIPNDFYDKLACPNHCIMVGPRGSGKTTLMRMLEVESLELWDGASSEFYRKQIGFSGVFVPTDRYWKTQYDKINGKRNGADVSKEEAQNLAKALILLDEMFAFHVFEQFISVVNFRSSRVITKVNGYKSVKFSKEEEVSLVKCLSELWDLQPSLPTLRSLYAEIILKKKRLSKSVNLLVKGKREKVEDELDIELIDNIKESVSLVNNAFEEYQGKWAFLFDELELAPDNIIQPLVDQMRGGHKNIIFKLALSPYHQGVSITDNPHSSMKSEDLKYINLSGLGDKEGVKFSKQLCTSLFNRSGLYGDLESYFSKPSPINTDSDFKSLIEKDSSFKSYLESRELLKGEYDDSDSLIRKIKFIAHLRNHKKDNKGIKRRRRAADFYAGFDHVCKSVEYNPRMLIGLMSQFIPLVKNSKNSKVSVSEQIRCLESYFESFKALLGTIALDSNSSKFNNIYNFIEEIAGFFANEIYGVEFKSEPKGCFKIEPSLNPSLREIVGYALNAGALVIVDNNSGVSDNHLGADSRKVCRLSYMFSHHFGLLMTKQKEIDLDELVKLTSLSQSCINVVKLLEVSSRQFILEFE